MKKLRLTQYTKFSGCAAKLAPEYLDKALCGLKQTKDPNFIVGFESAEDAGVYKINKDLAIVQTLDFFPPIVDDPYLFGQIACANALSDIYAMGGRPITAMNIVAFPKEKLKITVLRKILKGSLSKLKEAKVILVGGHTIEDPELKYGLSITGLIHPDKIIRNNSAKIGDEIILTKPIGTGIINTAIKGGLVTSEEVKGTIDSMATLNKKASEIMQEFGVHACTDATGFGLIGHLCEMIGKKAFYGITIYTGKILYYPKVKEFAKMGILPEGMYNNKTFWSKYIVEEKKIAPHIMDILFDPQTSGGLLISVSSKESKKMLKKMRKFKIKAEIIGEVIKKPRGKIILK